MAAFRRTRRLLFATLAAPLHELLPGVPKSIDRISLSSLLHDAKISKLLFLRHGRTGPSTTGVDFDRLLTDEGRDQAKTSGSLFGSNLNPFFPCALVSSAPRTVETAQLFLEAANAHGTVKVNPVDTLYDGTMQPKGSAIFRKLGYAPLRDYLQSDDDDILADSQQVLGSYARNAVHALMDVLGREPAGDGGSSTLLVVGHAIYLPAAVLAIASLLGADETDVVMDTNTTEAEGYLLDLSDHTVRYLSRGQQPEI